MGKCECSACGVETCVKYMQVGKIELPPSVTYTSCPDCARLKALLADVFPIIDNALNYFYPSRDKDGDNAMDARARMFELRDKLI